MSTFTETLKSATADILEKEKKNYKIDSSIRLFDKLELNQKQEWDKEFNDLLQIIQDPEIAEKQRLKLYKKSFNKLASEVRKKHGFTEKGFLRGTAIGLGVGIGVAVGAGLQTINVALLGAGIAIGVAVGVAIGAKQEKEAETKGKVY